MQSTLNATEERRRLKALEKARAAGYPPLGAGASHPGATSAAAKALNLDIKTLSDWWHRWRRSNGEPEWWPEVAAEDAPALDIPAPTPAQRRTDPAPASLDDRIKAALLKGRATLDELAARQGCTKGQALDAIEALRTDGVNVHQFGQEWGIEAAPPLGQSGKHTYTSRPDGTYCFGFTSDNHYGSKYERDDVAQALYDRFVAAGCDRVFNAGNWIDGESSVNKYDLKVYGLEAQCRHLANLYPRRDGLITYAVTGEDHEGWYTRREGIDPGRFAEKIMRDAGREDWVNLGFIEGSVDLVHAGSGAKCKLAVFHPGGGSSYAVSYRPQKIIESLEGGEKPAVLLLGHFHKLSVNLIRNVWVMQTGCTEDQTPFMRQKSIEAHIGGGICWLEQDERGAITGCTVQLLRFFNTDYYDGRWDRGGDVRLPERRVA